ncbi:ParA family protein [Ornithinimicrobium sp. Y1847]|uniref:ParA family protein n=1 Tax=Ornithinimicrobium sp. Y1847 TaxID=3405419 RepID=UPI003B680EA1
MTVADDFRRRTRGLGWPTSPSGEPQEVTTLGWPGTVSRETPLPHTPLPPVASWSVSRETPSGNSPVSRETSPSGVGNQPAWTGTRILTVANQKGGVGKTTTAVNIAAALAQRGLRVLVIDMDPQGNASTALSIPHTSGTAGIYDVLIDGLPMAEVVQQSPHLPGLLCVPATIDLAGAEIELVPLVARENRLRRALTSYLESRQDGEQIDLVMIDCPPSLGLLTVNAFVAAREVLIPIQCEYYALEGLSQLLKNVELIRLHLNADLDISTILLTMFDGRTRLAADVASQVREYFGDKVLRAAIPRSVRISEAPSHGETVITYDPTSSGALSYIEAATQMQTQGGTP